MNKKDLLFLQPESATTKFCFNGAVAEVFDDMISRSIPFYDQLQAAIVSLAGKYAVSGTTVYDLGCSTGTTLLQLTDLAQAKKVQLCGLDYSPEMLCRAAAKIQARAAQLPAENLKIELLEQDFCQPLTLKSCSVVILNLVLQFLPKAQRPKVLAQIYAALVPGGAVILIEKVGNDQAALQPLFTEMYHNFKKAQGYSEQEIVHKAQALKTVLRLNSFKANQRLLKNAGFQISEPFFRWYNFAGYLAVK